MSQCLRFTTLPDCSKDTAIADWDHKSLCERDRNILINLVLAQPLSVDALGSTETLNRMAIVFSAETQIATSPACLFKNLMLMRKAGVFTRKPLKFRSLAAPSPEVPA